MRGWITSLRALLLATAVVGLLCAGVLRTLAAPAGAESDRERAHPQPALGAAAAIAVDLTTGIELQAINADTPLPPASTVKIVTALVAVQLLARDASVTVEAGDIVDPTVFSNMTLQAGDVISVEDLLRGLLIQSGGDAALALARAGGRALDPSAPDPIARFVQEMNAYADRNGMTSSAFTNPTGADDPAQVASARDLVRASQTLLQHWLLAGIVRTPYALVSVGGPAARDIELFTTNLLLERGDVFGIKTGTEELAGQCLVTGFWRGDNQIITVVLGSPDRYADTQALMEWVDASYRWVALGAGTRSLGATDELAAQGLSFEVRRTIIMTAERAEQLTWEIVPDARRTYRYGVVVFRVGDDEIARLPVY